MLAPNMTRKEKLARIAEELKQDANRSDRRIGRELGVNHITVGKVRQKLADDGLVPFVTMTDRISDRGIGILSKRSTAHHDKKPDESRTHVEEPSHTRGLACLEWLRVRGSSVTFDGAKSAAASLPALRCIEWGNGASPQCLAGMGHVHNPRDGGCTDSVIPKVPFASTFFTFVLHCVTKIRMLVQRYGSAYT